MSPDNSIHSGGMRPGEQAQQTTLQAASSASLLAWRRSSVTGMVICLITRVAATDRSQRGDEQHPRCGPCTRLNRECDWDHRWNFNDATTTTQGKYSNISTAGNAVWDPTVRHEHGSGTAPGELDSLPEFSTLTNDEDRETKARTSRPGTYGVVVTPESFYDLPEYAATSPQESRRMSGASSSSARGARGSGRPGLGRSNTVPDPTVVVLDKFEDASPVSTGPMSAATESRRSSFPDALGQLSITTPPYNPSISTGPHTPQVRSDEHLIAHFRQYIVPRLAQPQQDSRPGVASQGSTKDVLEFEATRFPPLHHAMCAISALHLTYNGRSSLEEAMQHYHQALAASATPRSSPPDLLSDGVFFRHFLLFVYDICIPMQSDDGGTALWAEHLNHLGRIAVQRRESTGNEPYAYTLWSICELDVYACLLGSGNCDFLRKLMNHNMIPSLEQQILGLSTTQTQGAAAFLPNQPNIFRAILHLNQGILLRTAKLAQTAQTFRQEATAAKGAVAPETWARWQSTAAQLQTELHTFWQQSYPENLLGPLSDPPNPSTLPERIAALFTTTLLLYHTSILYARTSLFPTQRTLPSYTQNTLTTDSEARCKAILSLASATLQQTPAGTSRRKTVFPVFIAGVVSLDAESKRRALELVRAFEGSGIGQNTYRTRLLLKAVCEEQERVRRGGERVEGVEWLGVMRERGLGVVNCGL
ncbi:hypothetical protein M409DRAFT_21030 [Zasmidium cellare ATCC 36951]|uniref:Zn(2)-C6 fungal-type domain-containing protein n=1 Tax=Zasmidium cellare ATCC 36951 TaxID=1080233 RepID=A0A6A6CTC0_ZASCE|nr:uncharacterized protein M409DRAFT_21030 [Zasmidium cellare ATCC 36951]KAF2169019.1 hypothetical protein M409DRAFT_21030 [Zasmidium cellare ATCC 36951]